MKLLHKLALSLVVVAGLTFATPAQAWWFHGPRVVVGFGYPYYAGYYPGYYGYYYGPAYYGYYPYGGYYGGFAFGGHYYHGYRGYYHGYRGGRHR
jgi:hypothetical protein